MAREFKIGDTVKPVSRAFYEGGLVYTPGDIGKVVGGDDEFSGTKPAYQIEWPRHMERCKSFWYTPASEIRLASVVHSEDYLKDKDVL